MFNFIRVGPDRKWLQDLLLSDTESDESDISDEDEYIRDMLRNHLLVKKIRDTYHKNLNNSKYGYYSSSLLSMKDSYNEHKKSILLAAKRRRKEREEQGENTPKLPKMKKLKQPKSDDDEADGDDEPVDWEKQLEEMTIERNEEVEDESMSSAPTKVRGRRKSNMLKTPEMMAVRRKKVWQVMAKKEIGKLQRARVNNHKEMVISCKRVATMCLKIQRQKAMQSQKIMKETVWRAKRLTREMQSYWKRYDRVERENKRRLEKEAEEQRKLDVELIEAKRQQRKLNFLITQTELYAHFMSKKLGHGSEEEQLRILNQLDEDTNPRLSNMDDYNSELMKIKAQKNASDAYLTDKERTKQFDQVVRTASKPQAPALPHNAKTDDAGRIIELPQPSIFKGKLIVQFALFTPLYSSSSPSLLCPFLFDHPYSSLIVPLSL